MISTSNFHYFMVELVYHDLFPLCSLPMLWMFFLHHGPINCAPVLENCMDDWRWCPFFFCMETEAIKPETIDCEKNIHDNLLESPVFMSKLGIALKTKKLTF